MDFNPVQDCTLLFCGADREALWREVFNRMAPNVRFCSWPDWQTADRAEFALVWRPPAGELVRHASLQGIFSVGAGVDHLASDPALPVGVPVIRMVDPTLTAGMGEFVVLNVLYHHREMTIYASQQRQCDWRTRQPVPAQSRSVGIMGVGELGGGALNKLKPFGFELRGWGRSTRCIDGVKYYAGNEAMPSFLNGLDILVCLLPLTLETRGILNRETFAYLADGAAVINVGRGDHLVEKDLIVALDSGKIGAATLDVFNDEPLAEDHVFWRHPGVLVTPHIASVTSPDTAVPGVLRQIRHFQHGEPFTHLADMARGY